MKTVTATPDSGERGVVVVLAAALIVVIMAMAALVVDTGMVLMGRTDASTAVDLAAIGGAQELPDQSAARTAALDVVDLNLNRTAYPETTPTINFPAPNVIRVQANMDMVPDDSTSGPYTVALVIIEALEATNGDTTPEVLMDALLNVSLEGPGGLVSFDPTTKAIVWNIYICEVVKGDAGYALSDVFTYESLGTDGLE